MKPWTTAWLALLLAACGGIAIIDEPGGSSGSGSQTPSGATGDPLCRDACAALEPCEVDVDRCVARCSQVTPGCEELREPFLTCLAEETTPICDTGLCEDEQNAYVECLAVAATGGSCGGQSNTCACLHEDDYGNVYDYQCFGDNDFNCSCALNDLEIGQCSDDGPTPCRFGKSCCSALVFAHGFP